jgi:hypothetical protein
MRTAVPIATHTAPVAPQNETAMEDAVESRGPVVYGPLGETAAVEILALTGTFASARSLHPTDSPPAADSRDSDDSDSSRCLALSLAPKDCSTPLSRADGARLCDPPGPTHRGPLESRGLPVAENAIHAHDALQEV